MLNLKNTLDGYLKNVEVIGNTIQDVNNLADIRSVGDKVEGQELYKIDIVSCGKNLFNGEFLDGVILSTAGVETVNVDRCTSKDFIKFKPSINCYIYNSEDYSITRLVAYDKDKNFIKTLGNGGITPNNCEYIRFTLANKYNQSNKVQLEEGTQATPYEPYQENKLEILSPVQLEKVGDVADRIICKDGVWGVEKNIVTERLTSNLTWFTRQNSSGIQMFTNSSILNIGVNNRVIMCNTLEVNKGINQDSLGGYNQILAHKHSNYSNNLYVTVENVTTIEEFKKWLDDNPTFIKYSTNEPQFISLPHDQQIKLRTFAGQTNISFLTEIAGQIKAQVPKSLGATVNTHTEQIKDLHNSLDRVKKLEETTVSTVETESNFTTVEATNNGYFEDVKLEGKTLVNLVSDSEAYQASGEIHKFVRKELTLGKILTIYGKSSKNIFLETRVNDTFARNINCKPIDGAINQIVTLNSDETAFRIKGLPSQGWDADVELTFFDNSFVILEGDHTNNPPEYFEGLMSVGQDVEEVSVESVTNNLFKIDGSVHVINKFINDSGIEVDISTHSYIKTFTEVQPFKTYIFNKKIDAIYEYDKDMNFLSRTLRVYTSPFTIQNKNCRYIGLQILNSDLGTNLGAILNGLTLNYGDVVKYGSEHQSNKKPIVYYNPTTETWEKPILREWDTIEKHSDGKYYYHQRSEEVDYISGDENLTDCITDMNKTVKKISTEKVYECTNIDLMTYSGETNYIINSGAISPKSLLKVHNNISNVVKILQEKVSLLENTFIAGLKSVLSGDMYSLATILYPEDFEQNANIENDIMVIPE